MIKNFLANINHTLFINPKLNNNLSVMLKEENLTEAISLLKEKNIVLNYSTFLVWLHFLEQIMEGKIKSQFIGEFNKLIISHVKEQENNNDVLKQFYQEHNFSHKGLSSINFNQDNNSNLAMNYEILKANNYKKIHNPKFLKVFKFNSEKHILIDLFLSESDKNDNNNQLFVRWLIVETLFGDIVNKKPETILTLKSYYDKNYYDKDISRVLNSKFKYPLVLIQALNKALNKKELLEKQQSQINKGIFSNIKVPSIAKEKVSTIKTILKPLLDINIICEEDKFTINQILNNYVERDIATYVSMPEQYRDNIKNSDGFTMSELLLSNLDKYISIIKEITIKQEENEAINLLKQQTLNNKFIDTKISINS